MVIDGRMRPLTEVLDAERALVAAGTPVCGADHHGDPSEPCERVRNHEATGEAARESHARVDTGTAEVPGRYWVTWQNMPGPITIEP